MGSELVFNCTRNGSLPEDIFPQLNNEDITDPNLIMANPILNGNTYTFGPVLKNHDGSKLRCRFELPEGSLFTVEITLNENSKPIFHCIFVYHKTI